MRIAFRFVVALILTGGVGFLSYLFTSPEIPTWYASLNLPPLTPPNTIFGPVWTTIYIFSAITLVRVWNKTEGEVCRRWMWLFGIQLLLNFLWSMLFFDLHALLLSWIEIVLLWFFLLMLTLETYEIDTVSFLLLLPYLAWVSFATMLNVWIWWIN